VVVGCLPPPVEYGAPHKYTRWRDSQEEALVLLSNSNKRISVINSPIEIGKSLIAYMYGVLMGLRVLILTESRGLEDVYDEEFRGGGLVDIRGANNYPCPVLEPGGRYDYLRDRGRGGAATCDVG